MKAKLQLLVLFVLALLLAPFTQAQTSRVIPFNNVPTTIAPSSAGQILTIQLWDAATAGSVSVLLVTMHWAGLYLSQVLVC